MGLKCLPSVEQSIDRNTAEQDNQQMQEQVKSDVRVNLLEYLELNLDVPKKALVIRLLNKPWKVDVKTLGKYVPEELCRQFETLRADILTRLEKRSRNWGPLLHQTVDQVAVGVLIPCPNRTTRYGSGNDMEWVDQIWAQVVEDVEDSGSGSRTFSNADRAAFVMLYTIAHACVFVIGRVHIPVVAGRNMISMERNSDALEAHRLYWFAHYMSSQSYISDHMLVARMVQEFQSSGSSMQVAFRTSSKSLTSCREYFVDKYLSLHPDYIQLMRAKDNAVVKSMKQRFDLIVYIHVWLIWTQFEIAKLDGALSPSRTLTFSVKKEDLQQAGFHDADIDELVADCAKERVGDRLLEDIGNGDLQLGDICLKYAVQKYCQAGLVKMNGRGDWFEKEYIANYIRERVPAARYSVYAGVKDAAEKYDADVIILDKRTGNLMFCQVKHRSVTLHPHLRDEMKEYSNNSEILKGLQQIKALRDRICSEGVLTRVRQRLGDKKLTPQDLSERARYLMIHTSENLDFCTSDGVAMYEWNTLRNLMAGTVGFISKNGQQQRSNAALDIELCDPARTMDLLWAWLDQNMPKDQPMSPSAQWKFFTSAQLVFKPTATLRLWQMKLRTCAPFELDFPLI